MIRRAVRGFRRDETGGHAERPWVYFMIDSFFLVTQFFVLTFQMKTPNDLILPNKLPASGGIVEPLQPHEILAVQVHRNTIQSPARYSINGGNELDLAGVSEQFGAITSGHSPDKYTVRVSYGERAVFGDVLPIFNTCAKLRIKECGLQASRERVLD
jgi:hypothetical protein